MANFNDRTILAGKSMATSFVSDPICLVRNVTYSFQAAWTGSPVGNFSLQMSDDTSTDPINLLPTIWTPYAASISPAGGAAGTLLISYEVSQIGYNWVQFVYTATSGTGLLLSLKFNGR